MKGINTRKTWQMVFSFAWFLAVAAVGRAYAGNYYTYQDANGNLVISNNAPPPGRKIIKTQTLSEVTDQQIEESRAREAAAGFDNRLSSLEQTIGELSERLGAQRPAADNLQQDYGDAGVVVSVTNGIITKRLHRPMKRPTNFKPGLPNRESRPGVPAPPQPRLGARTG